MRTLALTVAYDGTEWAGSQRQSRRPTIQGALEDALARVLQHEATLAFAGRTDAGVHALGQIASLRTTNPLPVERVPVAVNRLLPPTIRVRRAREVPAGFHARISARYRRYWYLLQATRYPDPVRGRFCWQVPRTLELAAMQAAVEPLRGQHDFAAFRHGGPVPGVTTVRTLQRAEVRPWRGGVLVDLQADAFVHQMVRILVANLVAIGVGERPVCWMEELLRTGDRHLGGLAAPSRGLILMRIGYGPVRVQGPGGADGGEVDNEKLSG